jgi:enoyl-CoA hydratase
LKPHFTLRQEGLRLEIVFDDGGVNLLSRAALDELNQLIRPLAIGRPGGAASHRAPKLLVFRSGRPRLFAAGADMNAMKEFGAAEALEFAELGQTVFDTIERLPLLTVAAIDGDCFGGALDLALAFDQRVATRRSRFAHPGARLGIVTGFGGTVRLPRLLGRKGVNRLLLANEQLSGSEAAEIGLVDLLLDELAGEWLDRFDRVDPQQLMIVRSLQRDESRSPAQLLELGRNLCNLYSGRGLDGSH